MYVDVGQVRLRWTVAFDDYPGRDARDGGGNASQLSLGLSPFVFSLSPPLSHFCLRVHVQTPVHACSYVFSVKTMNTCVCLHGRDRL